MQATRTISLTRGLVVLIDADDYAAVMSAGKWHPKPGRSGDAYAHRNLKRDGKWTTQTMHAFLTGWSFVDHANGNGLDNRRCNLRQANPQLNMRNRRRVANASGFKGVSWNAKSQRWVARITVSRRTYSLGYYDTADLAAAAYDEAALHYFGEFARPNFPQHTISVGGDSLARTD